MRQSSMIITEKITRAFEPTQKKMTATYTPFIIGFFSLIDSIMIEKNYFFSDKGESVRFFIFDIPYIVFLIAGWPLKNIMEYLGLWYWKSPDSLFLMDTPIVTVPGIIFIGVFYAILFYVTLSIFSMLYKFVVENFNYSNKN